MAFTNAINAALVTDEEAQLCREIRELMSPDERVNRDYVAGIVAAAEPIDWFSRLGRTIRPDTPFARVGNEWLPIFDQQS